jgi:hypothetical protein
VVRDARTGHLFADDTLQHRSIERLISLEAHVERALKYANAERSAQPI